MNDSVVFFGTGPVAARALQLLQQSFTVEAVITKPRPLHHKGSVPVLELAERLNLPVVTTTNKSDLSATFQNKQLKSQVGVLIDFGIIVAQDVIDAFPLGIINSHFSLLPQLRGADPITFAILEGLPRTGVSLMLLVEAMDEGPLLDCSIQRLDGTETTPQLTEKLILLSDKLLKSELPRYTAGITRPVPQSSMTARLPNYPSQPSYSRKLTKADGILDFSKSARQLEREVRAFLDWPKSQTVLAGKEVVITKAHVLPQAADHTQDPGVVSLVNKELHIGTTDGVLVVDALKPAGKPEMTAQAFLNGYGKGI